jgi:hypothetical protein
MLHRGERVVPAAQVSDRGRVDVDMEMVASEIRGLRQDIQASESTATPDESVSGGTVRDRDILEALNVALNRNGNRDPLK